MKQTLLSLTICFLLFSCKKNASNDQLFSQCNRPQLLDSTAISNKIVGSWTLIKQRLGSTGKVEVAKQNIKVIFNSNSTYVVMEDSSTLTQGNWSLKIVLDNMWGLDLTSPNNYLYGFISFCNNQVSFNFSYLDGNDNLFEKAH